MARHPDSHYSHYLHHELILRDRLAADRTVLANERTFLAYARTALALTVGGITLVRFFGHGLTDILGWVLIPLGALTLAVGTRAYLRMRTRIAEIDSVIPEDGEALEKPAAETAPPSAEN